MDNPHNLEIDSFKIAVSEHVITDKQNKGLFVFDTVFIGTIIWLILSGSPDNGPDKDSIENKMPFILYFLHTILIGYYTVLFTIFIL
jgi:hypothetical protein